MREMEVKVLDIDKELIEEKLISIGAELVKDEFQTNLVYDSSDRALKEKYRGYIRIRITEDFITGVITKTMTFKKNISIGKIRNNVEYETEITNENDTDQIIKHLGFDNQHRGTKHRKSYRYENILFEIDTWDKNTYPKPYLEIEVIDEGQIEKAIKLLNISNDQITSKSIEQLREEVGL